MYKNLQEKLNDGEVLILDGGTGSELEQLGAPMHSGVWCGAATGSHPHLVRQVHENYIAAGADIITTNTYASNRESLAKSNLDDNYEAWNKSAVALALEARDKMAVDRPIYVAGSLAPYDHWFEFDPVAMRAAYREHANLLVENGVDFLLLEMLASGTEQTFIAIEEAAKTGVPIWVSISCLDDPETGQVYLGAREDSEASQDDPFEDRYGLFTDAVEQIARTECSVLSVMHSEIRMVEPALRIIREHWSGPMGAYPNAGYWERPNWTFKASVSAEFYAQQAQRWVDAGAQIVGGCCGIGQHHIRAVSDSLRG